MGMQMRQNIAFHLASKAGLAHNGVDAIPKQQMRLHISELTFRTW